MAGPLEAGPRPLVRCVVADHQTMFVEMLSGLLAARPGLLVVAQASTVPAAVAACRHWAPDLVLLGTALPGGQSLAVARALLEVRADGRVIVLADDAASFDCPPWLGDRVHAVIGKNGPFDLLRRALDGVVGELPASPRGSSRPGSQPAQALSEREAEVFCLIGDGLSTGDIAIRLGVSQHTVSSYRKRIAAKLGTQGDELTHRALASRVASASLPD